MNEYVPFVGIAPHPPIMVPEVGREYLRQVDASVRGMREFAQRLVATKPDTIVVISPHTPIDPDAFSARWAPRLSGNLADFRAPEVDYTYQNDLDLLTSIRDASTHAGLSFSSHRTPYPLDHGVMVPLYFLHEAGWCGPIVTLAFANLSEEEHLRFGKCIVEAAEKLGRRIAIVASGDLSHRLKPGAPAGYEPDAHLFDEAVGMAIEEGKLEDIPRIDQRLRYRAGECGYRSIVVASGAVGGQAENHEVISYEGPFGVGYLVAILREPKKTNQTPEARSHRE